MESEPLKILGTFDGCIVQNADFQLSASCNRVQVKDGHLESVSLNLMPHLRCKKLRKPSRNSRRATEAKTSVSAKTANRGEKRTEQTSAEIRP